MKYKSRMLKWIENSLIIIMLITLKYIVISKFFTTIIGYIYECVFAAFIISILITTKYLDNVRMQNKKNITSTIYYCYKKYNFQKQFNIKL